MSAVSFTCKKCKGSIRVKLTHKCNWIPDSKGGEPNCKKQTLL